MPNISIQQSSITLGFRALCAAALALLMSSLPAAAQDNEDFRRTGPASSTVFGPFKPVEAGPHIPMPRGPLKTVSIRLARDGCFGSCPRYSVEIHGDGRVVYEGKYHVLVRGRHERRIDPQKVAALLKQIDQADFWSLAPKYEAPVSHTAPRTVTVMIGKSVKTVEDSGGQMVGMPQSMISIEEEIDDVAGTIMWVRGTDDTLPALRASSFDFRSEQAAVMLAHAARNSSDAIVLGLLEAGAGVNKPAEPAEVWRGESSALRGAVVKRRLAIVRRLIDAGARVDLQAFGSSVRTGQPEVVELMLSRGADPHARDDDGETPLHWATRNNFETGHELVLKRLIEAGADLEARDDRGRTPFHAAYNVEAMRTLIDAGARLDVVDARGRTALDAAFAEDTAIALWKAGVQPTDRDVLIKRAKGARWDRLLALIDEASS